MHRLIYIYIIACTSWFVYIYIYIYTYIIACIRWFIDIYIYIKACIGWFTYRFRPAKIQYHWILIHTRPHTKKILFAQHSKQGSRAMRLLCACHAPIDLEYLRCTWLCAWTAKHDFAAGILLRKMDFTTDILHTLKLGDIKRSIFWAMSLAISICWALAKVCLILSLGRVFPAQDKREARLLRACKDSISSNSYTHTHTRAHPKKIL